jgi:hypothetical protein
MVCKWVDTMEVIGPTVVAKNAELWGRKGIFRENVGGRCGKQGWGRETESYMASRKYACGFSSLTPTHERVRPLLAARKGSSSITISVMRASEKFARS